MHQPSYKLLTYWIEERERVRRRKESGEKAPWSADPVFQTTYFCNVDREDDKTTRFIRGKYNPRVYDPHFLWNIALARFINNIPALAHLKYYTEFSSEEVISELLDIECELGKLWGGAYLVSTNGRKMSKITYIVEEVLAPLWVKAPMILGLGTLKSLHEQLTACNGIGSFMSGQIIADLKNTPECRAHYAEDWETFAAHGPGSLRGLSWVIYAETGKITPAHFDVHFHPLHEEILEHFRGTYIEDKLCAQNFQNCLCEFDKYMRVSSGVGKSKRKYNGR